MSFVFPAILALFVGLALANDSVAQQPANPPTSQNNTVENCQTEVRNWSHVNMMETMCNFPYALRNRMMERVRDQGCGEILTKDQLNAKVAEGSKIVSDAIQKEGREAYCERITPNYIDLAKLLNEK